MTRGIDGLTKAVRDHVTQHPADLGEILRAVADGTAAYERRCAEKRDALADRALMSVLDPDWITKTSVTFSIDAIYHQFPYGVGGHAPREIACWGSFVRRCKSEPVDLGVARINARQQLCAVVQKRRLARRQRTAVTAPRRWLKWQVGRQGSGYRKMLLAEGRLSGVGFDCYLLDYPTGSSVPPHTDPVPGKRHVRANLRLLGEDRFVGEALFRLGPLVLFRPDIVQHEVRAVSKRRVILSIGIAV